MADATYHNARLVSGDPKAIRVPGTVAEEIKAGDFMMLVSGKASPVSSQADLGTTAQNQEGAHDAFLGVALDGKEANETRDVLIGTAGVYKYPCAALGGAEVVGALFGPDVIAADSTLYDQQVVEVATANLAFGKLARNADAGATEVYLEIAGVLSTPHSGVQAMA